MKGVSKNLFYESDNISFIIISYIFSNHFAALPDAHKPVTGSPGSASILDMLQSDIPSTLSAQSPLKQQFQQQQLDASLHRQQEMRRQEEMLSQYQNSMMQQQQVQQVHSPFTF